MPANKRYKIRFPDPHHKINGSRYLFSMSISQGQLDVLCESPIEELVVRLTPPWSLTIIGMQTLTQEIDIKSVLEVSKRSHNGYSGMLEKLFARHSPKHLSTGRPHQGKDTFNPYSTSNDIGNEILAYWEQGLKLVASILHTYFTQLSKGERLIALSLQRLLANIINIKRNGSLAEDVSTHQIKQYIQQAPKYTIAYIDDEWVAFRNPLENFFSQRERGGYTRKEKILLKAAKGDVSNSGHIANVLDQEIHFGKNSTPINIEKENLKPYDEFHQEAKTVEERGLDDAKNTASEENSINKTDVGQQVPQPKVRPDLAELARQRLKI